MSQRGRLYIFVKEPHPGRVKTRLGKGIGMVAAAWWFRHQSLQLIRRLGSDARWETVLAVSPDTEGMRSRVWPGNLGRAPQGSGDLGARMKRALLSPHNGPVIIVGSDIPAIRASDIANGFKCLGSNDTVFGPAEDGGYWLIGFRHTPPKHLFNGVRWSTEHALADTIANLKDHRIGFLRTLNDVDEAEDL